jgi:hypothetical protein
MSNKRSFETNLESTEQPTKKRKMIDNEGSILFALFMLTHTSRQSDSAVDRFHHNPLFDANCVSLVVEFLLSSHLPHLPHLLLFAHNNLYFIRAIHQNHQLAVYEGGESFLVHHDYVFNGLLSVDDNSVAQGYDSFSSGNAGIVSASTSGIDEPILFRIVNNSTFGCVCTTAFKNFQELVNIFHLPRPNPIAVLNCSCKTLTEVNQFFNDNLPLLQDGQNHDGDNICFVEYDLCL